MSRFIDLAGQRFGKLTVRSYAGKTKSGNVKFLCMNPGVDRLGRRLLHAHHHKGYAEEHMLDVDWVCAKCHVKQHPRLYGEQSSAAKLTEEQVIEIRAKQKTGAKYRDLAAEYGVTYGLIGHICRGRIWKHLISVVAPPLVPARTRSAITVF